MSDLNRAQAIQWCIDNHCDFFNPVFPPPEGWCWGEPSEGVYPTAGRLVLQPIFTCTTESEIWLEQVAYISRS